MGSPHAATRSEAYATPAASAARHSEHPTLDPGPAETAAPAGGEVTQRRLVDTDSAPVDRLAPNDLGWAVGVRRLTVVTPTVGA